MSTALRDLLWSTSPLSVHYTGHTTAETGGTAIPVQYDDDAPYPMNVVSITPSVAIARLAYPEGIPMRRHRVPVYDDHVRAIAGACPIGPTLDEQRRQERQDAALRALVSLGALTGSALVRRADR